MREIRIKNVKASTIVHFVVALKSHNIFLFKEDVYEKLRNEAAQTQDGSLTFVTGYGQVSVETVIEVTKYSAQFYKILSVTVNDNRIYGTSPWVEGLNEIVVIDAD